MGLLEWVAAGLGLLNIILILQRSVWNFPVALVMVTIYGYIFASAKLYSDAGLQLFFFALNVYGWWAWSRNKQDVGEIVVAQLTSRKRWQWVLATAPVIAIWGWLMLRFTDASYPWWDGAVAMISVTSQILMTRRYIENWHGWILVNLLSIPLYLTKGLFVTAFLYLVNLLLSVNGLSEWRNVLKRQNEPRLTDIFS